MIEKVNPCHPDKVADRIAGAIVDLAYKTEKDPKIAVEVLIGHGVCYVIVETSADIFAEQIKRIVHRIAGQMAVVSDIKPQDKHLADNQADGFRCGDNGIFKGMPLTDEEKKLSVIARDIYKAYPCDGKYIMDGERLIICQSNAKTKELRNKYPGADINPIGDWTGGTDVDTGATNRKLGSDMAQSVTGGGLHGKDLSKADVSVNIHAFLKAQKTGQPVVLSCAIGDDTAYIEIPKKQGKSELAAAVALLLTCGDGEERAEVYGCAADRQQASIVFEVAADMVRMCPALSKRVKILASQKRIIYMPTNSFYQVLSAEAYSKHGFNIHGVVFDELHTQPNRKLFDVMTKGSGDARMQPLYFLITTAGTDTNSICYETHQKAKDILEGRKIDPTFYPVIYGADESDDWTDPKVWKKANPSLGITVGIDKVKAACDSAKQNPGEENSFRQLRLNQWVKQAVRWMPMEKWDKCSFAVSEDDLEGRVCYGGLDLSSTTDITAFVLVFPPLDEEDKFCILPYFWIPEETLELRVRRDHVPYDVWKRQGYLQTTEGNVVHYGYIERFIEKLGERFNIREIAFDRWGAVQMVQNLEGMGFTVVPFGQGFKDMSPPTKELMKLTLEQKLAHGGHPVLRWMMDNIYIRTDPAGNIKADKEKSTEKIDGAVATIMALDRAIRCGNQVTESVYDHRGILFI